MSWDSSCKWTDHDESLTFSAAMALDPSEVEYGFGGDWFNLGSAGGGPWTLNQLRAVKFRRARPKRSRVQETWNPGAKLSGEHQHCREVVTATLAIRAVCEYLRTETPYSKQVPTDIERHFLEPR